MKEVLRGSDQHSKDFKDGREMIDDPAHAEYLRLYRDTIIDPAEKAELDAYLKREPQSPENRKIAFNHVLKVNDHLKSADFVLSNLSDEGIAEMEKILERMMPDMKEGELPLWINGLAISNPAQFALIRTEVTEWKKRTRDQVAERTTSRYSERIHKLGARYGIPEAEMDRFMLMNDRERLAELEAAIGTLPRVGRVSDLWTLGVGETARGMFSRKNPAGDINALIREYRQGTKPVRDQLWRTLQSLAAIDTRTDPFWQKIPEILQSQRVAVDARTELKLKDAQQLGSVEHLNSEIRARIRAQGGAEALRAWDAARIADPATAWNATFTPTGGGTDRTFGSVFDSTTRDIRDRAEQRGFVSTLMKLLFAPFLSFTDSRDAVARLGA